MTTSAAVTPDPYDWRVARGAEGLLAVFNQGGVLEAAEVHVARRLAALAGETDDRVKLAVAFVVRAARLGAVCVDLNSVEQALTAEPVEGGEEPEVVLPWPAAHEWVAAVAASPLCTGTAENRETVLGHRSVLRLDHHDVDGQPAEALLYLDRHWREEDQVLTDLLKRLALEAPDVEESLLLSSLDRLYPKPPPSEKDTFAEQRLACDRAVRQWTTVLTGGPGTGKTASVARLLVLLAEQFEAERGVPPRIALAAPTGKASARLGESVAAAAAALGSTDQGRLAGLSATTLHRLLGWRPDSGTRFKHHRQNPLPYDVVVVDEVSMVSLTQMARLFEAVRDGTRLILVGDPNQLASVEAGAVLKDLVEAFDFLPASSSPVAKLTTNHRTRTDPDADPDELHPLDALAQHLRDGDQDESIAAAVALLLSGEQDKVTLVDPDPAKPPMAAVRKVLGDAAWSVAQAASSYDPAVDGEKLFTALDQRRLLCVHRDRHDGVSGWNRQVEQLLAEKEGTTSTYDDWYPGRQVLITANDRGLGVSNGDIGVVVSIPEVGLRVALRVDNKVKLFAPTRLSGVETVFAMTVHKSQGSEAEYVTVVLPRDQSRLLTRELLYTAVTRAREGVTIVGTREALEAAVRLKVQRASGLRNRLAESLQQLDLTDRPVPFTRRAAH